MAKIAVLGYGTVGSGTVEVLSENRAALAASAGQELSVKYIVDVRDFPGDPNEAVLIKDFAIVETDPDISVVVETIGGVGVAYQFTKRALAAGKSVVTSNKELVATHGLELMQLAKEHGVCYLFEASVGGGIPILRPLIQCLCGNRIEEIFGILNGTTNYILTRMVSSGDSFESALTQAQALGYAEQNPSADIDGIDPCRKICILSGLAFGNAIDPDCIKTEGIRGITLADVAYADKLGCKLKLLARALRCGDGIYAYVAPHLLSKSNILSGADDVMNGVVVRGSAVGEVMFYGPGAGRRFTASAVVADVMDCVRWDGHRPGFEWGSAKEGFLLDSSALQSEWYVRADSPAPNGCAPIGQGDGDFAFVTGSLDEAALSELTRDMKVLSKFRILK